MLGDLFPKGTQGGGGVFLAENRTDINQHCGRKGAISSVAWFAGLLPDAAGLNKLVLSDRDLHVILAPALAPVSGVTLLEPPLWASSHPCHLRNAPATRESVFLEKSRRMHLLVGVGAKKSIISQESILAGEGLLASDMVTNSLLWNWCPLVSHKEFQGLGQYSLSLELWVIAGSCQHHFKDLGILG